MCVSTYERVTGPQGMAQPLSCWGSVCLSLLPSPPHALEEGRQEDGARSPLPSQPPAPRRPAPPTGSALASSF